MAVPASYTLELDVNPGELASLSDYLRGTVSPICSQLADNIKSVVSQSTFWRGKGANACRKGLITIYPHIDDFPDDAAKLANGIDQFAKAVRDAKDKIEHTFYQQILDEQEAEAELCQAWDAYCPPDFYLRTNGHTVYQPSAWTKGTIDPMSVNHDSPLEQRQAYVDCTNTTSASHIYEAVWQALAVETHVTLLNAVTDLMKTTDPIESNVIPQIGGLTELTGRFAQELSKNVLSKGFGKAIFRLGIGTDLASTAADCASAKSLKQFLEDARDGLAPVLAGLAFDVAVNPIVGAAAGLLVTTAEAIGRAASHHPYGTESQAFATSLGFDTDGAAID
ncbi:MAG: WXG100 family type VII secretion target [Bifidobacteriaceae bacterium]|jgi:uncharacterized protein YukE|nr:WXG100 family type VII secretion target [Bifidobacteriaceae bacterium]